jgi:hypothetical protein
LFQARERDGKPWHLRYAEFDKVELKNYLLRELNARKPSYPSMEAA